MSEHYVYRGRNQFPVDPQIVGNELKMLEAKLGHAPSVTEIFAESENKNSAFHWVRKRETILALQLDALARLRQAIGRVVTEEVDGKVRTRVEQLYASLQVNSGRFDVKPFEEVKRSPVLSSALMLDRLARITYAQQAVLSKADALEEVDWSDETLQRKIGEIEQLHAQIMQFRQPRAHFPPPPEGKKRKAA
jgi:hypothetical protein